jgi:hypothetical protein
MRKEGLYRLTYISVAGCGGALDVHTSEVRVEGPEKRVVGIGHATYKGNHVWLDVCRWLDALPRMNAIEVVVCPTAELANILARECYRPIRFVEEGEYWDVVAQTHVYAEVEGRWQPPACK